jgi:hypothetical protein
MYTNFNLSVHFAIDNSTKFNYFFGTSYYMHITPHFLSPQSVIRRLKINKYLTYIYIMLPPLFQYLSKGTQYHPFRFFNSLWNYLTQQTQKLLCSWSLIIPLIIFFSDSPPNFLPRLFNSPSFFVDRYFLGQKIFNCLKRPIHSQLNWAILLCDVIPDGKTE